MLSFFLSHVAVKPKGDETCLLSRWKRALTLQQVAAL
jgi:hypothetical protein